MTFEYRPPALSRAVMRGLPELKELVILADHVARIPGGSAGVRILANLDHDGESFPLIALRFGPADPSYPTFLMVGGVHGLERIGTQVVLSYLKTLTALVGWDRTAQEILTETRLVAIPLLNPVGMYLKRRANGNRVDLMRNAPVRAERMSPWQLFGGQRLSSRLPWYQGLAGARMEPEAQALCDFVRREVFPARVALGLDVHSGYGQIDRLWFPFAKSRQPFPSLAEAAALKRLLDRTLPHHVYCIEPQSNHYLAHGDLWDYLYEEHRRQRPGGCFIPFTLEMGSWLWVKKNWSQAFSILGAFNPRRPHRIKRTLRRHLLLFDLFHRAVRSSDSWSNLDEPGRSRLHKQGLDLWFQQRNDLIGNLGKEN